MKRFFRWFRSGRQHKYINGGKGVISIFLAVLMLPFLTMADFLVETGRYHEAVSLLDESMDSAALSTLSYNDEYMLDRFGLMSISQDVDISETYNTYLEDNLSSISSWDISGADVEGTYTLSNTEVLMQQIAETSKYSAPTALAADLKLSDLVAQLEEITSFGNFFSVIESTGNAVDAMLTLSEDLEELLKAAKQLEKDIADYDAKYEVFERAVQALVKALQYQAVCQLEVDRLRLEMMTCTSPIRLKALRAKLRKAEKELNKAKQDVERKKLEFIKARDEYAASIAKIIPELIDYQEKADKVMETLTKVASSFAEMATESMSAAASQGMGKNDIDKDIEDLNRQIESCDSETKREELRKAKERLEAQKNQIDTSTGTIEGIGTAATEGSNAFIEAVTDGLSEYNRDKVKQCVEALKKVKVNVETLDPNRITENFVLDKSKYYVDIEGLVSADAIQMLMDSLEDTIESPGFFDIVNSLCAIFRSLFTSNGIYDSRLNACILKDADYAESDLDIVLQDISELLNYFEGGVLTGIVNVLEHMSEVFDCLEKLAEHLVDYLEGITVRAVSALRELLSEECGKKFLLDEYLLKALANRCDMQDDGTISGGNDFTGFPFSNVPFGTCPTVNKVPIAGGLESIIQLLRDIVNGGNDVMFHGAELEYILVGNQSEIVNQTVIFMNLYFVRLIADMGKILGSQEVRLIAEAAAGVTFAVGGVIVFVLYILIEPLIDCIFIVNKVDTSLFKSVIYLAPSGIPIFLQKAFKLGVSPKDEADIKKEAKKLNKKNKIPEIIGEDGICWDYENYLFVFMLLFGENETYLKRLQNIIGLEENAYYGQGRFNLNDTYTYLEASANGTYNPILPLGDMSTNGIFTISRSRSRGY